jgi:hypothetical protein
VSTIAIIAIVIAALLVIGFVAIALPRMRSRARIQKRERELQSRRDRVAGEHRAEAESRELQAEQAEQRARIAAREAEAERAQAELHQERAGLHERGLADDELIDDSERDRFAGTSAMSHDRDGDGVDDRREGVLDDGRPDDRPESERPARFGRSEAETETAARERSEQRF